MIDSCFEVDEAGRIGNIGKSTALGPFGPASTQCDCRSILTDPLGRIPGSDLRSSQSKGTSSARSHREHTFLLFFGGLVTSGLRHGSK